MSAEEQPLEAHRPFVRDLNHEVSGAYGYGGMAVLAVLALYAGGLFWWNAYTHIASWLAGIAIVLAALKVLSVVINRRKERARTRLLAYCETNGIASNRLKEYFVQDDMYPFFAAIVDDPKRLKST